MSQQRKDAKRPDSRSNITGGGISGLGAQPLPPNPSNGNQPVPSIQHQSHQFGTAPQQSTSRQSGNIQHSSGQSTIWKYQRAPRPAYVPRPPSLCPTTQIQANAFQPPMDSNSMFDMFQSMLGSSTQTTSGNNNNTKPPSAASTPTHSQPSISVYTINVTNHTYGSVNGLLTNNVAHMPGYGSVQDLNSTHSPSVPPPDVVLPTVQRQQRMFSQTVSEQNENETLIQTHETPMGQDPKDTTPQGILSNEVCGISEFGAQPFPPTLSSTNTPSQNDSNQSQTATINDTITTHAHGIRKRWIRNFCSTATPNNMKRRKLNMADKKMMAEHKEEYQKLVDRKIAALEQKGKSKKESLQKRENQWKAKQTASDMDKVIFEHIKKLETKWFKLMVSYTEGNERPGDIMAELNKDREHLDKQLQARSEMKRGPSPEWLNQTIPKISFIKQMWGGIESEMKQNKRKCTEFVNTMKKARSTITTNETQTETWSTNETQGDDIDGMSWSSMSSRITANLPLKRQS